VAGRWWCCGTVQYTTRREKMGGLLVLEYPVVLVQLFGRVLVVGR